MSAIAKVTKEMIIDAAFEIAKEMGAEIFSFTLGKVSLVPLMIAVLMILYSKKVFAVLKKESDGGID